MKTGFCCLYGRANAGKSTLLNALLKIKLEAVSPKPQTTLNNIQGVYNDGDSQIVFVDTPGLLTPHGRFGQLLLREAESARVGVDVIVYVVDACLPHPDRRLIDSLRNSEIPVIVAYNKIDSVELGEGQSRLAELRRLMPEAEFCELSALKGFGTDTLIAAIKKHLPEGQPFFPPEQLTDRPTSFIWAEMIREKCFTNLEQEVPHAIHVEVTHEEKSPASGKLVIFADIIVERASEKAIVIGRGGQMLSRIRHHAEHTISVFMNEPVELELYVKVVPDWREDSRRLREYGYKE